jgi:hypothetical protein
VEIGNNSSSREIKIKNLKILDLENTLVVEIQKGIYRVSQKWRTNGALRCKRDYRKRQKNV